LLGKQTEVKSAEQGRIVKEESKTRWKKKTSQVDQVLKNNMGLHRSGGVTEERELIIEDYGQLENLE